MNKHSMFLLLSLVSGVSSVKSETPELGFFGSIRQMVKDSAANGPVSKGVSAPEAPAAPKLAFLNSTRQMIKDSAVNGPVSKGALTPVEEVNAVQSSYATSALKAVKDNPALTAGVVAATVIVGVCVYNRKAIKKALFGKAASSKVVVA